MVNNLDRYYEAERVLWHKVGVTPVDRRVTLPSGGKVRVQEVGDGPPVVFIHGGSIAGSSWCKLAAQLDGVRSILVDRPGCGLSDPIVDGPLCNLASVEAYADRLLSELALGAGTYPTQRLFRTRIRPRGMRKIDAVHISIKNDLAEAVAPLPANRPSQVQMHFVWDSWVAWARQNRDAHTVMNLLHQANLASSEAQQAGIEAIEGPATVLTEAMDSGILVDLPLEYLAGLIQNQLDQAVISDLDDDQAQIAFGVLWNGITQQRKEIS